MFNVVDDFESKVRSLNNLPDYLVTDIIAGLNSLHFLAWMIQYDELSYTKAQLTELVKKLVERGVNPNLVYYPPSHPLMKNDYDSDFDEEEQNITERLRPETQVGTPLHFVFFTQLGVVNLDLATALVNNGSSLNSVVNICFSGDARVNDSLPIDPDVRIQVLKELEEKTFDRKQLATPLQVGEAIVKHIVTMVERPPFGKASISAETRQLATSAKTNFATAEQTLTQIAKQRESAIIIQKAFRNFLGRKALVPNVPAQSIQTDKDAAPAGPTPV